MSSPDLDLGRKMPNVELLLCSSFKLIDPLFFSYHTDTQTDTQTHRHEYSIVAV